MVRPEPNADVVMTLAERSTTCVVTEEGLASLSSIGGDANLGDNGALTSLDGLDALISIEGSLSIDHNTSLLDVSALHALSTVGGGVAIVDNPALSTTKAEALIAEIDSIGGDVIVTGNAP